MVDVYQVQSFTYALSHLFNPTEVGWYDPRWEEVRADWVTWYRERRTELVKMILSDFKKKFKGTKVLRASNFLGFGQGLHQYKSKMLKELQDYKINSIDKKKFFNFSRSLRATATLEDKGLAHCLTYITTLYSSKMNKEEIELLLETFCYCFSWIASSLDDQEVNKEKLEELGLPTTVEELKLLVETVRDLGELFDWHKTDNGFVWWATYYLRRKGEFKYLVYEYLNSLHSELKLPTKPPSQPITYGRLRIKTEPPW